MLPWDGPLPVPQLRTIEEIRGVLMDKSCECRAPLYSMYRDLAKSKKDRDWLRGEGLRYDLTVIPPRTLCGEYVKTKGHHHPPNGKDVPYPEIYEVLQGEAHYLLQTRDAGEVRLVKADEGDLVLVPPGFGHVTINPGRKTLSMANIVSTRFESDYSSYERLHGAAYFEVKGGDLVRNPNYPRAAEIQTYEAREQVALRSLPSGPLYNLIGTGNLGFLNHPEEYPDLFS